MQLEMKEADRMPLSIDYRENLGPIHPRISLAIIIIKNHSLLAPMNSDVDAP